LTKTNQNEILIIFNVDLMFIKNIQVVFGDETYGWTGTTSSYAFILFILCKEHKDM
jgi:hypothetical protein